MEAARAAIKTSSKPEDSTGGKHIMLYFLAHTIQFKY